MTSGEDDHLSEDDAARRRDEIVRRMIATPPKPRTGKVEKPREPADSKR
jgi:hypothetical protein